MARTGAITIKRCGHHCNLVHPDPAETPNRPAEPREPATAAGLTDALRGLIRVSKSAGMNAMSEFGYLTSTQMADDEEISEAVQCVHAAIEAEARAAMPPALDVERLARAIQADIARRRPLESGEPLTAWSEVMRTAIFIRDHYEERDDSR